MLAAEDSVQAARALRLAALQRERDLDLLLVSEPVNLRYLTGFTGSNGLALLAAEPDQRPRFFTDFRYATQSAEQLPALYEREIVQLDLLETAARLLAEQDGGGRLGF